MDDSALLARAAETRLAAIHRAAEAAGHTPDSPAWEEFVDRERRLDRARRTREAQWARAAGRYQRIWEAAGPVDLTHGYMVRKQITSAPGLRQSKDVLLIPMKGLEQRAPLMNLQRIWPDGRKLFGKGGRAARTRTTIGAESFKKDGLLYVCEGWATGWSIFHVTGDAVVVAFSAGNLEAVTVAMREKYPKATIVVAADNDRWGSGLNPGVTQAREAAAAARALVAIPDFGTADGRPTDFNDLYVLDGADAVRRWLDPDMADRAAISAPVAVPSSPLEVQPTEEARPEVEPSGDDDAPAHQIGTTWQDLAPFRCLGYDRGTYFYLPRGTGQITELTASQHDRKTLLPLAPASWWEHEFPARNGVSWGTAADAMLRASERVGVFRPDRIRGRGCWPEKGTDGERGVLLHLGDRLLAPGSKHFDQPERFQSPTRHMYERQHHLRGPSLSPMALADAREILATFQAPLWREPASGYLAAGWTVLAPICGALPWRPHIWIPGERGCGKSTILSQLIVPLLGGMGIEVVGLTTEAGIRQELRADALAVVFDEAEEDEAAGHRIQSVLALARQASSESGARTLKGTIGGSALQFRMRSMFCLASIGAAVTQESDRSRISVLQLRGASQVDRDERRAHWRGLAPRLDAISEESGQDLIARTLLLLRNGVLPETLRVFRHAAAEVLGDQRSGDQYGTLFAGAWTLMADQSPDPQEARELLSTEDLGNYQADSVPEGKKALDMLLQQIERLDTPNGPRSLAVGQLVDIACGRIGEVSGELADARLRQIGIRVTVEDGAYVLYIANSSEWLRRVLRDSMYARGVRTILLTLPGVAPGDQVRFHPGLKSRTIRVPYALLD